MITNKIIEEIIINYLKGSDIYLVEISNTNSNQLSIYIDSFEGVTIDECANLSKHIESKIDRDIEDFELLVSSAGLDLPFKIFKQYQKHIGSEIEVLKKDGEKYSGKLITADLVQSNPEIFEIVIEYKIKKKLEGQKRKKLITEQLKIKSEEIKKSKAVISFK